MIMDTVHVLRCRYFELYIVIIYDNYMTLILCVIGYCAILIAKMFIIIVIVK